MSTKIRRVWTMFVPLTLGLVLALALAAFASHSVNATEPELTQEPDEQRSAPAPSPIYRDNGTIDVGPVLRNRDLGLDDASVSEVQSQLSQLQSRGVLQPGYGVGDVRIFAGLDNAMGFFFLTTYEVRLISDTVEVWVQSDLSYPSPVHPDSKDPEYVTQDRIEEIATAFQDVIRPTNVNYFGSYDTLTGTQSTFQDIVPSLNLPDDYFETDNGQRTIVLVQNVRDGNYYDPANNPSYIAGFYSPTFEGWADRNIITIDSKQWNSRVGAPSFLYESVTVHEMQHLVNDDYDNDEESWANEGRSEFSEFIAGYRPEPESHRTEWSDYPENSLTVWGDQDGDPDQGFEILADYQEAYWFLLYLTGRLADDGAAGLTVEQAVQAVAQSTQDPENGIDSIDAMLSSVGASFTFADVWADFRSDLTAGGTSDGTSWGDYISTYATTSSMANAPLDVGRLRRNLNFEGYDTHGAPPNGSDYLEIGWSPDIATDPTVHFTGEVGIPTEWSPIPASGIGVPATGGVSGDVLYSGHSDLTDNFVIFETTVPSGDPTLAFDTLYNIELGWDYGFVQVTTDTAGATGFTSLDASGTMTATASGAHPIIVANVPGYSDYSGGWVHVEHDLSAYAGDTILLAFRYASDWAFGGQVGTIDPGWYLDNVSVGGTDLYTETLPASAQSIWQARDNEYAFDIDFVTYDGDTIDNTYPMSLTASNGLVTGTFDMLASTMLADTGFNGPNERAVGIVSGIAPSADDDLIGAPTQYLSYTMTSLPASINTSRARSVGTAAGSSLPGPGVYPGDNFSVTVTVDNLGRNDDLETEADSDASVAIPVPMHSSVANSGDFTFFSDLSTADAGLPAVPGVYWTGTVSEALDLNVTLEADMPLTTGLHITPTAHFANGSDFLLASQTFTDSAAAVEVESPLAFSAASVPTMPVPVNQPIPFYFTLVNTDDGPRDVDFSFTVPADTSLHSISFGNVPLAPADVEETTDGEVRVTVSVPSFLATDLARQVTVELLLEEGFSGDTLSLAPTLYQPNSNIPYHEFAAEDATVNLFTNITSLPVILR